MKDGAVIIVSASQRRYERVLGYLRAEGDVDVEPVWEPSILISYAWGNVSDADRNSARVPQAAILDLSLAGESPHGSSDEEIDGMGRTRHVDLAWYSNALLAVARALRHIPCLLISDVPGLDAILSDYGVHVEGSIHPNADVPAWRHALGSLLGRVSESQCTSNSLNDNDSGESASDELRLSQAAIRLRADLWFDTQRCVLGTPAGRIPLTAQEFRVLMVLAREPNRFHGVRALADSIEDLGGYSLDRHCLEQTIHGLRRKFGETARDAHLIVSKRGLGYALMIGEDVRTTGVPSQELVAIAAGATSGTLREWTSNLNHR